MSNRIEGWKFRLMLEYNHAIHAHFVTLTYHDQNLPVDQDGQMVLVKSDFQKFMKRLRKISLIEGSQNPIKFFACGEYGEHNERPHYHAIIFNATPLQIERAWSLDGKMLGIVHIGTVTENSVAYTLKYMCKQINPHIDSRPKEFQLMSKGLGALYLSPLSPSLLWHHTGGEDDRYYLPVKGGGKIPMPRYYKDKIYTKEQRKKIGERLQDSQPIIPEKTRIDLVTNNEIKLKKSRLKTSL